jgi:uncharacterized membrane protein YhaH (DUF805 family)
MEWLLLAWRKYIDFSGRARRKEYWMFVLGLLLASAAAWVIDGIIFGGPTLGWLIGVAAFIPAIACQVRRFQDQDRTGWFVLLNLIPAIGNAVVLVLMCLEGTRGPNLYGPDPKSGAMAAV